MLVATVHCAATGQTIELPEESSFWKTDKQSFEELQVFGGIGSFEGTSGTFTVGKAAVGRRMAYRAARLWARVYTTVLGF